MMNAKNILYLHSHDTGRYIRPYGHAVSTPHLQRFAERGVTFRHAFCANPTCSPSRACLLTGQYAHINGMMGLAHRGGRLNDPSRTLPALLRDHGYDTVLAGFQHIADLSTGDSMQRYGYSHEPHLDRAPALDHETRDEATVDAAVKFLGSRRHDQTPFFLDAGFFATHRTSPPPSAEPKVGADAWHNGVHSPIGDPRYVLPPACLPDTPTTRKDFADFAEAATRLDRYYGQVLDELERAGLAHDTLVLITTDHGLAFPRMKCNLTAHGIGVAMMMAGPGAPNGQAFTGGRVIEGLVSHVDWFPTVCGVLNIQPPDGVQGQSMLPLLEASQDDAPGREAVFAEVNYHAAYEPMRSVRTHDFSYIRRLQDVDHAVYPNIDDSVTKRQAEESGFLNQKPAQEMLFDLRHDPAELCNCIDQPAYGDIADSMRARLDRWMKETHDPALQDLPRAAGIKMNSIDDFSPTCPTTLESS
ncbi:MAG: sulfatase [Planctomycetota bacterium]